MEWITFPSGKRVCRCHYMQICPTSPTAKTHTPSALIENRNTKKDVSKNIYGKATVAKHKKTAGQSISERFHNYRVSFKADVDWDLVNVKPKMFGKTYFKQLEFSKAIVQVFSKSILVIIRSSSQVVGLPVSEAKLLSDSIISEIIPQLPNSIKVHDRKIKALHNAFMNHPTALHNVNVEINGEKRLISDNSHGVAEFEAIHPLHAISDSEALEQDNIQLIDKGLSRDVLAQSIKALVDSELARSKDQAYYAENLKSHVVAIRELAFMIKRLRRRL